MKSQLFNRIETMIESRDQVVIDLSNEIGVTIEEVQFELWFWLEVKRKLSN